MDPDTAVAHLTRVLDRLAGAGAVPRDDQVEAVHAIIQPAARVLVVQATGWGKSAVYWAATSALRSQGAGPSLVVSPLLALMRDQVTAAEKAGLRAATVNSTNIDAWDDVFDTDYFSKQPDNKDDDGGGSGGKKASAMVVTSVETARRNDGGGRFG